MRDRSDRLQFSCEKMKAIADGGEDVSTANKSTHRGNV